MNDYFKSLEFLKQGMQSDLKRVENGEIDSMLMYCFYKDLEKALKETLEKIFVNVKYNDYDLDTLPFNYSGRISHKLTINYETNLEYKEKKDEIKSLEKTLKDAVLLAQSGKTLNDENGVLVEVPEWKQTEIFTIIKKK